MSDTNIENTGGFDSSVLDAGVLDSNGVDGEVLTSGSMDEGILPMPLVALSNTPEASAVPATLQRTRIPLEAMHDVPVTLVFEVGRTDITIKQLMELREGSFVELRHVAVDTIDVWVNDKIIAEGEAIALQQRYGIRFGEVKLISIAEKDYAAK